MGIQLTGLEKLRSEMVELAATPRAPKVLSARDAIRMLANEIANLQTSGYTVDEILQLTAKHDIQLSVNTFRTYLTKVRKETNPSKRRMPAKATKAKPSSGASDTSVTLTSSKA